jgi:DNA-binding CsgD family transcriptional regulator
LTADLQPAATAQPPTPPLGGGVSRCGAEVVHLAEALYVHFLQFVLAVLLVGCGLAVTLGSQNSAGPPRPLTIALAALGAAFSIFGLACSRTVYRWLRYDALHQMTPAAIAAIALTINGPDSATWWEALPLLWIVAVVSSTRLTLLASLIAAAGYLAGTLLGGESPIPQGDHGILSAAIGLPVNAMAGRYASEAFARFVLRLHRLEPQISTADQPLRVPNLAARTPPKPLRPATTLAPPNQASTDTDRVRGALHLTARQLEVALLTCDGLRQAEIAVCLAISPRQVERLIGEARERAQARTTSHLVAMLIHARIAPPAT